MKLLQEFVNQSNLWIETNYEFTDNYTFSTVLVYHLHVHWIADLQTAVDFTFIYCTCFKRKSSISHRFGKDNFFYGKWSLYVPKQIKSNLKYAHISLFSD